MTKTKTPSSIAKVSDLLQAISPKPRLEILLSIGAGEACVCHLESILGYRQAYISQHLMELREAGVLSTRRDGKFIFYHLEKPEILEMVALAAHVVGMDIAIDTAGVNLQQPSCNCPNCVSQLAAEAAA